MEFSLILILFFSSKLARRVMESSIWGLILLFDPLFDSERLLKQKRNSDVNVVNKLLHIMWTDLLKLIAKGNQLSQFKNTKVNVNIWIHLQVNKQKLSMSNHQLLSPMSIDVNVKLESWAIGFSITEMVFLKPFRFSQKAWLSTELIDRWKWSWLFC